MRNAIKAAVHGPCSDARREVLAFPKVKLNGFARKLLIPSGGMVDIHGSICAQRARLLAQHLQAPFLSVMS